MNETHIRSASDPLAQSRVVEVFLSPPGGSIAASIDDMVAQSGNRELVGVLRQLRQCLAPGLKYLVPTPVSDTDISWLYNHDFEGLLERLGVPKFHGSFVHHTWENHFAPHCSNRVPIALALSIIFEAQAEPTHRATDVQQAAWYILFFKHELASKMSDELTASPDETVMDPSELAELVRQHDERIREAVKPILEQKSVHAWNPQSALRALGYRVGQSGRPAVFRRGVLRDALLLPIDLIPIDRRAVWGGPGTRHRLRSIERLLHLFKTLASGKDCGMERAIEDWSSDLVWLEREYGHRRDQAN